MQSNLVISFDLNITLENIFRILKEMRRKSQHSNFILVQKNTR